MEKARLFALYASPEHALAALDDLKAAGFGAGRRQSAQSPCRRTPWQRHRRRYRRRAAPASREVNVSGIGPLVVIGPLADPLRDRDIVDVLQDKGVERAGRSDSGGRFAPGRQPSGGRCSALVP